MIDPDQKTIQRITALRRNITADPEAHQDRNHDNRQRRRTGHGVGLGEGQRAEQPPLLPFKGEDGNKGERDDQQADKQRRSHLDCGIRDHPPARRVVDKTFGMAMRPLLQALMGVLDHHDCRIDHRPHRNGDPSQRHDIGVQPLIAHDDKGDTQPQR